MATAPGAVAQTETETEGRTPVTDDPFATASDPFSDDPFTTGPDASAYPKLKEHLRGRLVIFKPTKFEQGIPAPSSTPANPQYQNRVTADVWLVDGPIADGSGNVLFDGQVHFEDLYFSQDRIVKRLARHIGGKMPVGRPQTRIPAQAPGKGNAWGLLEPSTEDMTRVRAFWAEQTKPKDPFAG